MPDGAIVIVSGPPGAGKTTVGTALVDLFELAVRIVGDDLWSAIERGAIPPYLPASRHQNEVVVRALGAAATEFAAGGYLVVLETVIGPWLLPEATAAALGRGIGVHYVVLRPDADTTRRRALERPDGLRDADVVADLTAQFDDLGRYERFVVDSSDLDVPATVERVVAGLELDAFRIDQPIDQPTGSM